MLAVLAALGLSVVLIMGSALAAAQETGSGPGSEPVNASEEGIDADSLEGSLGNVDVLKVEFTDGNLVKIYVNVPDSGSDPIAVTDSGATKIGSNQRVSVPFEVYRPPPGEHELRFYLASGDELITIQEGEEMMAASGDRATLDILSTAPTVTIVRWAAISGAIGTVLSLAGTVGFLRRRHQNTYKELLSEERVKVEEDPVEGVLGRVTRFASNNRYVLLLASVIVAYTTAAAVGYAPGPFQLWGDASDSQRVVLTGSAVMTVGSFPLVYVLAVKLWDPAKEFVVDVDARDVLDPSLGSNGGLALDAETPEEVADEIDERDDMDAVAVYSGAPERVSKMRVDGAPAEARTPGGTGHVVQDFEPKRNAAVGCWPGTASDVELLSERSKIDGNREILRDESRMLRTLIGAMPAIATASDTDSMRAVDREIRQLVNVDSDPIDNLLNRAASGTRFEGIYSNDEDGDEDDEEEKSLADLIDPRSDDEDDDDEEEN
jgi:hypothetical protein